MHVYIHTCKSFNYSIHSLIFHESHNSGHLYTLPYSQTNGMLVQKATTIYPHVWGTLLIIIKSHKTQHITSTHLAISIPLNSKLIKILEVHVHVAEVESRYHHYSTEVTMAVRTQPMFTSLSTQHYK